jgi:hypothetical protein
MCCELLSCSATRTPHASVCGCVSPVPKNVKTEPHWMLKMPAYVFRLLGVAKIVLHIHKGQPRGRSLKRRGWRSDTIWSVCHPKHTTAAGRAWGLT